ncbi:MAG: transglutaminase domain-containing protein [Deltaproteobacteria bacterium]|nr:transglutaminase domain-containing protein [Deltaproteobacteria bacterium]
MFSLKQINLQPVYRRQFFTLQLFRAAAISGLVVFLTSAIDIGTSSQWIITATVCGVLAAGHWLLMGHKAIKIFLLHVFVLVIAWLAFSFGESIPIGQGSNSGGDFAVYRLHEHLVVLSIFYVISLASTWIYWRSRWSLTAESTALAVGFVAVLSDHRNYNLDAPKKVNDIAWYFGIEPQHMLLALASAFTLFLSTYLVLSNNRPIIRSNLSIKSTGSTNKFLAISGATIVFCILFFAAKYINRTYAIDLSRASSGVGDSNANEGESPLGFHSAVGKTKQPSALVRLESNYENNPWSPMLYLRESALSEYNGREFVIANPKYDTDLPWVGPGQSFAPREKSTSTLRRELLQSIFLLTNHSAPFSIDFPIAIQNMKNPDDSRFKLAYGALSLAPVTKLENLIGEKVGDDKWRADARTHYLRAPGSLSSAAVEDIDIGSDKPILDTNGEDLRYRAMADSLTKGIVAPVEKAIAISNYLSQNSIYTRSPGHDITAHGDPVAAYLFSDAKRGYCVHFAHAAAYMMRLAGVPARIATGYLTDLRYAKDAHILLHLGDRHAWPEIYVQGHGWVVVDVTPANAENEQVIVPDEKLLEELMSKLEPLQPIPNTTDTNITSQQSELISTRALKRTFVGLATLFLFSFICTKLWFRHGWRLVSGRRMVRLAYTSLASLLADIGHSREIGETRKEYSLRITATNGLDMSRITLINERSLYDPHYAIPAKKALASIIRKSVFDFDNQNKKFKRILAFFSPLSLMRQNKW